MFDLFLLYAKVWIKWWEVECILAKWQNFVRINSYPCVIISFIGGVPGIGKTQLGYKVILIDECEYYFLECSFRVMFKFPRVLAGSKGLQFS